MLTTGAGGLPPFQLTAMAFAVATSLAGLKWAIARQHPLTFLKQPPAVWLLGVGGLFGFHAFYFLAMRLAPPIEASPISYLRSLLIVVLSGLVGCGLRVSRGGSPTFDAAYLPG